MRKYPLLVLGGIATVILYPLFTLVSWLFYPEPYGPLTHYLSRLGDYLHNPFGAYFYNVGCVLTGLALFPFFIGFRYWYDENKIGRIFLLIGQTLGLCSAIALILIGVFSEDTGSPHMQASTTFFLLNFLVLILIDLGLLLNLNFSRLIPLYGLGIDFFSFGLEIVLGGPIVEWITVFGSLLYVGLVTIFTSKFSK